MVAMAFGLEQEAFVSHGVDPSTGQLKVVMQDDARLEKLEEQSIAMAEQNLKTKELQSQQDEANIIAQKFIFHAQRAEDRLKLQAARKKAEEAQKIYELEKVKTRKLKLRASEMNMDLPSQGSTPDPM